MDLTPIEYLRAQLKRYADRHGYLSYTNRRLSGLLDHLWAEWYEAMPDRAVAATVLQSRPIPREELVRRFETAKAQDDATTMVSILPHVLKLPKDDPDRPQMLNCCGAYGITSASGTMPSLILISLEEAANTAPQWSLLQLKALGNLGFGYQQAGRFYAGYLVYRMLVRHLHTFASQGFESKVFNSYHVSAILLGKERAAQRALRISQQFWPQNAGPIVVNAYYIRCAQGHSLTALRPEFQRLWALGEFRFHVLGAYAEALLRNGHPRAAMAVAQKSLAGFQKYHAYDLINQVDLLTMLAATSYRVGRDDVGDAFMARVEARIPTDEVARRVAARLKEWSA